MYFSHGSYMYMYMYFVCPYYIKFLCVYVCVCVCVVVDSQTGQQVKVHRQAVYESLKEYLKGTQCTCTYTCNSTELKCAMTDCCSG